MNLEQTNILELTMWFQYELMRFWQFLAKWEAKLYIRSAEAISFCSESILETSWWQITNKGLPFHISGAHVNCKERKLEKG